MTEKGNEWEMVKENILPLRQGRKISSLRSALAPKTEGQRSHKQQEFENELRTYEGNDPLEVWYRYIHWVEQNFPKGGNGGKLPQLISKCVSTFLQEKRYHNDERYIEIWIKYASEYANILEVYNYMYSNNIGCQLAAFYENWAWQLQQTGNSKRAFAILQEGLQRNAAPKKILLAAEKNLQAYLVQQVKGEVGKGVAEASEERACGNVLKPVGKNAAPINRVGAHVLDGGPQRYGHQQHWAPPRNQVQVFSDKNNSPGKIQSNLAFSKSSYPKEDGLKENLKKPGKWSSQRMKQNTVHPVHQNENKPTFIVHEDEEPALPQPVVNKLPKDRNILSAKKPLYEPPRCIFEPPNPHKIVMYNKYKVYGGVEEYQFEEIRAARLMAKKKEADQLEAQKRYKKMEEEIQALKDGMNKLQAQFSGHLSSSSVEATNHSRNTEEQPASPLKATTFESGDRCRREANGRLPGNSQSSSYNHSPTRQVQELWNVSLFHSTHSNSKPEVVPEEITDLSEHIKNHPHVLVYEDSATDNVENQENRPPKGYVQNHCKRSLAGILQQSTNIPMVPLEEQSDDDDDGEDDNDFGICPLPEGKGEGTITTIITEEQFNAGAKLKCASTPFQRTLQQSQPTDDFTTNLAYQNTISRSNDEPSEKALHQDLVPAVVNLRASENGAFQPTKSRLSHGPQNLSTIMEGSREDRYKSSSSASSSSGAYSTMGSTYYNLHSTNHTKSIPRLPLRTSSNKDSNVFVKPKLPEPIQSINMEGPIDPFSTELQARLLHNLEKPLHERRGYQRKSTKLQKIVQSSNIEIDAKTFLVLKEITKPNRSCNIFLVEENTILDFTFEAVEKISNTMVAKVNRPPNEWEFYVTNELHERLGCLPPSCNVAQSIMLIEYAHIYNDKSILLSSYGQFGTLLDLINIINQNHTSLSESLVLYLTYEMLQIVSQMHKCHIIHADVKPDNFLLVNLPYGDGMKDKTLNETFCLRLIDFGQSIDMELFPAGTVFTQQVQTSGFQCTEMLDHKPWTYQTDLFGVLGSIHIMLFSKYMEVEKNSNGEWQITTKFKRYWQKDFWQKIFHTLLNVPSCEKIPDLRPFVATLKEKLLERSRWMELQTSASQLLHLLHTYRK